MSETKPRLTRDLLRSITASDGVSLPGNHLLSLPEKVLQFGTGRFIRGFVDCIIHRANQEGGFGGSVVAVQSTGSGRTNALNAQDGLFTLCEQGLVDGQPVETYRVISSISRVLSASDEWSAVLACASNPELSIVVSNTTEAGLQLHPQDRFEDSPPVSFPAKLTRFLFERYRAVGGTRGSGMIVLPCELVEENGSVLRALVLECARRWKLESGFAEWVEHHNRFCDSLVDRIVTGYPTGEELIRHRNRLPFEDELLTCAERYLFWAIEGDEQVASRLPFVRGAPGVLVTPDIRPYFERKIRILNGGHTLMSPVSFLCGNDTVSEALDDSLVGPFVRELLRLEVAPTLPEEVDGVGAFVADVLERWSNPFLDHALLDITTQSTRKMRLRVVPTIERFFERRGGCPRRIAFGFAGFIAFVRQYVEALREDGAPSARAIRLEDDFEEHHARLWARHGADVRGFVSDLLSSTDVWGTDLCLHPGFADAVSGHLERILEDGPRSAIKRLIEETQHNGVAR